MQLWLLLLVAAVNTEEMQRENSCAERFAGVPGNPGYNGIPGRDGRDGSKGEKGDAGITFQMANKTTIKNFLFELQGNNVVLNNP